jgi:hypothetical protein
MPKYDNVQSTFIYIDFLISCTSLILYLVSILCVYVGEKCFLLDVEVSVCKEPFYVFGVTCDAAND